MQKAARGLFGKVILGPFSVVAFVAHNMAPTTRSSRTPTVGAAKTRRGSASDNDGGSNDGDAAIRVSSTTKSAAKKDKVYRKTQPPPELEQRKFPARRKTVRHPKTKKAAMPSTGGGGGGGGGSKKQQQQRHSLPASLGGGGRGAKGKTKDPKQSTLTQIGWVPSTFPEDDEEMDPLLVGLTGNMSDEDGEWGAVGSGQKETAKPKNNGNSKMTTSNKGRKRRKTTGSLALERDEEGGEVEVVPSSRFHTQTLTQMPSWRQSDEDEGEVGLGTMFVGDSDEELGDTGLRPNQYKPEFGTVAAERQSTHNAPTPPSNKRKRPSPGLQKNDPSQMHQQDSTVLPPHGQSVTSSVIPQTPSKQRLGRTEIPSSQPSPFTPDLVNSQRFWSPVALGIERTPLKERSTNVDEPMPKASGKVLKRTRSEIPDSWSTVNGGIPSSPARGDLSSSQGRKVKRTPLKEIHFVDVGNVSVELGQHSGESDTGTAEGEHDDKHSHRLHRSDDEVIMDSDEEFQGFPDDEPEAPGTPSPQHSEHSQVVDTSAEEVADTSEHSPKETNLPIQFSHPVLQASSTEECLAEVAASTPPAQSSTAEITPHGLVQKKPIPDSSLGIIEIDPVEPETPTPSVLKSASRQLSSQTVAPRSRTPEPPAEEDESEPETPTHPRRRPSSSSAVEKETPLSSPQKTSPAMPPVSQLGYNYKSQAFESQRVPFEIIRHMAPQTDRSDVIMSIHPEHVKQITDGTKTHEFRNYRLPQTVARMWIYITRPVQELKFMAVISGYKLPGEIAPEDHGVGNKVFNDGKGAKYAYELQQVYQLNNPVSLERMKENGWVEQAPQKYEYVPPAVLGELMGNLRCALFEEHERGTGSESQGEVTISQELREQLRSDLAHSTQLRALPSSPLRRHQDQPSENNEATIVPSSQDAVEGEHVDDTPPRTTASAARQVAFVKPTVPASHSQRSVVQIDDSPAAGVEASQPSQHVVKSTVRPSQATTASMSSQSQPQPSQRLPTQAQAQARTPARRLRGNKPSSLASLPEDVLVVDDSPVQMRAAGKNDTHTQSSLGLGLLLGSSQGMGLAGFGGEQDSLLDDSRIRLPPAEEEVVWDSEGDV